MSLCINVYTWYFAGLTFGDLVIAGPEALVIKSDINSDDNKVADQSQNGLAVVNNKLSDDENNKLSDDENNKLSDDENNKLSDDENSKLSDSATSVTENKTSNESEDDNNSDCGESTVKNDKNRTNLEIRSSVLFNEKEVEKRRLFFQREGNQYVKSFFEVIKKQEKTGG